MKVRLSEGFVSFLYVLLIVTTLISFRNRGVDSSGFDLQILSKIIVWFFCGVLGLIFWFKVNFSLNSLCQLFIVIFSCYIVITSPFSPAGLYSVVTSIVFFCFVMFNILLFKTLEVSDVLKAVVISSVFISFASLISLFLFPGLVYQEFWNDLGYIEGVRLKGLTDNANSLGQLCAFSLFLILVNYRETFKGKVYFKYFILALLFLFLLLSQSRTSFLALCIALSYYYFFRRFKILYTFIYFLFCFATVVFLTEIHLHILPSFSRSGSIEELFTFTGRTLVWEAVIDLIRNEPFFGYGYASSKVIIPLNFETSWGWTTVNSHSFLLQLFLSVGIVGALPVIIIIVFQLFRLFSFKGRLSSSIFIFVLITGILESGAIGPIPNFMTLVWLLSIFLIHFENN